MALNGRPGRLRRLLTLDRPASTNLTVRERPTSMPFIMPRPILNEDRIHPAIREKVSNHHSDTLSEVQTAAERNNVLVVGMKQNPFPRKSRAALREKNIAFEYLEYGSYLSEWRRRTAIKMWAGWPTFPMIFVKGTLIGGHEDLVRLIESGELDRMLGAE